MQSQLALLITKHQSFGLQRCLQSSLPATFLFDTVDTVVTLSFTLSHTFAPISHYLIIEHNFDAVKQSANILDTALFQSFCLKNFIQPSNQ